MEIAKRAVITTAILMSAYAAVSAENRTQTLGVSINPSGVAKVTATANLTAVESSKASDMEPPEGRDLTPPQTQSCKLNTTLSPDAARELVIDIASEEHFDGKLLAAVAHTESRFRMAAISPKGAIGLMQLMPATAARFGVDPCDATQNIRGGIDYLRYLQSRYQNPFYVLAAYNAGEDAVDRSHGIPPFPETVAYVAQVLDEANAWPAPGKDLSGSTADHPTKPKHDAPEDTWSQGFVMHVTSTEN